MTVLIHVRNGKACSAKQKDGVHFPSIKMKEISILVKEKTMGRASQVYEDR